VFVTELMDVVHRARLKMHNVLEALPASNWLWIFNTGRWCVSEVSVMVVDPLKLYSIS